MGLYLDAENGDKLIEGVVNGLAVQRKGRASLEIWDEDGDYCLGHLPVGMTPDQISAAIAMHRRGYEAGIEVGKARKQAEIRAALGVQ